MAKTLRESPISTPNARKNLPDGVHWRRLDSEVHLGYRKGQRMGAWLVRWRVGNGYKQAPLAPADDSLKEGTLSFAKAEAAARAHVDAARLEAKALADGPPITVRLAVEQYIAERDARASRRAGRLVQSDAGQRLRRYVLGKATRKEKIAAAPLADVALYALTEEDLRKWRADLPEGLKASSLQRLINDLKAALNSAYEANRDKLPAAVSESIRHGLKVATSDDDRNDDPARDNQILSDAEVGRLLRAAREVDSEEAWEGDLFRLFVVLAATGARFSQIARLRVRDLQADNRRLLVPVSRKGRGGKQQGHVPVPVGVDVIEALAPAIMSRGAEELLLERWRSKQAPGGIVWEKDKRGPWQSASEASRSWHAIRTRAELPEAVPYAFRHSSIVRGIRANLPIRLVAALHDTSVQMIERHYSRWITDGLDELAATAVVPLVPSDRENVVALFDAQK